MLKLRLPTDPRWVNIAEKNIEEILIDHAYCEQKASSTAISLIVNFPEHMDLVEAMSELAMEELSHFQMVIKKLKERGFQLGLKRKDAYVNQLFQFIPKGIDRKKSLVYRLLFAGMIEARSCERFKVLSENINDEDLQKFYFGLMKSEAEHYTLFLKFARKYGKGVIDVEKVWAEFLDFEAEIISKLGTSEHIHG
ncbi:MAG: tRNA-(ms[2]io[6]A)-hydroxylase [Salibacteraceae bacterium]|nr:tRNA-(ms[2]io[6]A)-hydroxylase [Salibacteraceae bacterium]|tara:strand:- start:39493 stop:40077 length:585 start_codon:yes stop_codon:yes gene_type:complete